MTARLPDGKHPVACPQASGMADLPSLSPEYDNDMSLPEATQSRHYNCASATPANTECHGHLEKQGFICKHTTTLISTNMISNTLL